MNKISFLSANELVFTEQMCQFRVTELYKVTFQEKKSTFFYLPGFGKVNSFKFISSSY